MFSMSPRRWWNREAAQPSLCMLTVTSHSTVPAQGDAGAHTLQTHWSPRWHRWQLNSGWVSSTVSLPRHEKGGSAVLRASWSVEVAKRGEEERETKNKTTLVQGVGCVWSRVMTGPCLKIPSIIFEVQSLRYILTVPQRYRWSNVPSGCHMPHRCQRRRKDRGPTGVKNNPAAAPWRTMLRVVWRDRLINKTQAKEQLKRLQVVVKLWLTGKYSSVYQFQ